MQMMIVMLLVLTMRTLQEETVVKFAQQSVARSIKGYVTTGQPPIAMPLRY